MMSDCKKPWNICIPQDIHLEPPGYLIGLVEPARALVFIHGISKTLITKCSYSSEDELNVVGLWQTPKENIGDFHPVSHGYTLYLNMDLSDYSLFCNLKFKHSLLSEYEEIPAVCIFYHPHKFLSSYILFHTACSQVNHNLLDKMETKLFKARKNVSTEKKDENNIQTAQDLSPVHAESFLENLGKNVYRYQDKQVPDVKTFYKNSSSILQKIWQLLNFVIIPLPLSVIWIYHQIGTLVSCGWQNARSRCNLLPHLLQFPFIVEHFHFQAKRSHMTLKLKKTINFKRFIFYNHCVQQLMDTLLGILFLYLIVHLSLANDIADVILDWADDVALRLNVLVNWLMGAPAGLKLNAQLTKFMGHFFIYHIYLWTGYLSLLRSVMPTIFWYSSFVGIFGVSAQLCLVRDVLSMLTLHIYCFYVYAARIFNVQVYALSSLWRLFRGKKWNVLRSRVDSAAYNTDQLFVGTLLFTVLLFLLPTTALYYAVFTLLRLLVLAVQGVIKQVVILIRTAPVFTIALRLVASNLVAGGIRFEVKNIKDNNLIVSLQTCQVPFGQLISLTTALWTNPSAPTHSWKELLCFLATGRLIYPWVDKKLDKKLQKLDKTLKTE
ncbi:phosphatidylinositol N-acetylglucosaminyltransferase subunit Q-like [Physella acuta]|uniref:phosphatidylinositol N-acetylglucosaminyltransferase subunit Q-like n=1 Tax=Physella acuta TaxID=109671 RepID=UPI0027DC5789|nr:phosphatidylinositol N-acetylglucosaminyltransferase subunit Q-like [Physella acuta]XP_059139596.1 phosphatidylinositol N-acetylglucosaminyltransferase subunit Q-like [Physella acuta]XP_059139597.1 phosphatidylinositol N-acetylglucosaminyltransferase subunit Q-like [Physella acuta]XP_059139598.1 phosphatidylinositol N-acetylglucosaminyltransferase subunit Q-like [Physella acuta]